MSHASATGVQRSPRFPAHHVGIPVHPFTFIADPWLRVTKVE